MCLTLNNTNWKRGPFTKEAITLNMYVGPVGRNKTLNKNFICTSNQTVGSQIESTRLGRDNINYSLED
jgi:hypothetical protein